MSVSRVPRRVNKKNKNQRKRSGLLPRLFFSEAQVLEGREFFIGGRGGYGVTHKGNSYVRNQLKSFAEDYRRANGKTKKEIIHHLRYEVLPHITFVMKRDTLLEQLTNQAPKKKNRNNCVLRIHGSVAKISSYPDGEYIDLGDEYAMEILAKKLQQLAREQRSLKKNKRVSVSEESVTSSEVGDIEDSAVEASKSDDSVITPLDIDYISAFETEETQGASSKMTPQDSASRPLPAHDHCSVFPSVEDTCAHEYFLRLFPADVSLEPVETNDAQSLERTRADQRSPENKNAIANQALFLCEVGGVEYRDDVEPKVDRVWTTSQYLGLENGPANDDYLPSTGQLQSCDNNLDQASETPQFDCKEKFTFLENLTPQFDCEETAILDCLLSDME